MKKVFLTLIILAVAFCSFAQERTIKPSELPRNAQILIKETFGFAKVIKATIEGDRETTYKYTLAGNTVVECDAEGNWTEIESPNIPTSLIPEAVLEYCNSKYPNVKFTKIEKELTGVKVELANDIDLIYNSSTGKVSLDK